VAAFLWSLGVLGRLAFGNGKITGHPAEREKGGKGGKEREQRHMHSMGVVNMLVFHFPPKDISYLVEDTSLGIKLDEKISVPPARPL